MKFWEKYDKLNNTSTNFVDIINNKIKIHAIVLFLIGFILMVLGIPLINIYFLKTNETLFWVLNILLCIISTTLITLGRFKK